MVFSQHLRVALVGLGLFAASLSGHAQQQSQDNVEKLLSAPIAGQSQTVDKESPMATFGKRALASSLNADDVAMFAPALKMAPDALLASMNRMVPLLALHLDEPGQRLAMQYVLASTLGDKQQAQQALDALPPGNVVTTTFSRMADQRQLLGDAPTLSHFDFAFRQIPKFNVQATLQSPGVAALQSILDNPCAKVQTSLALTASNTQCATRDAMAPSTNTVLSALQQNERSDGLLVGEYNGIPVLVMHDASKAHGSAAVFRLTNNDGTRGAPFIVFSKDLLNKFEKHPDTINFILEHELGHVAHNHTMSGQNHHEIEADSYAFNALLKKGMTPQRIANAYYTFEQVLDSGLSQSKLKSVQFAQMMESRHQNIQESSQQIKLDFPSFKLDLGRPA